MSDIYTPTISDQSLPGAQTTAVTAEPISATPPFQPAEIEKQYEAVGAAKQAELLKKQQLTEAGRAQARGIEQEYKPQLAEAAKTPEFKPSQATAGELAALFGMIGAMGALGGKGSYASALGAMNAMGGMLKGYNQGRKDLFDQEKAIYDKKIQENKLHFDRINQAYERALKAAPNNLSAAQSQLERELTGLGANVLAQQSKLEGMSKSYEMWRLARNNYEMNQARLSRNLRPPSEARPFTMQYDGQNVLARSVDGVATPVRDEQGNVVLAPKTAAAAAGLKAPAKVQENFVNQIGMVGDIKDLQDQLSDPKFRKKLEDTRALRFIAYDTNALLTQIASAKLPEDVQNFVIRASAFRNAYYLAISGKAVTGGEAQRNYSVVPQPADSPSVLDNKLKTMNKYINDSLRVYGELYPSLQQVRTKVESPTQQPVSGLTSEEQKELDELKKKYGR